jgi:protein tyrosine phosphatase
MPNPQLHRARSASPTTTHAHHRHHHRARTSSPVVREFSHETQAQMVAFAQRTIALGIQGLRQEFAQLRGFMPVGTRVAFDQNVPKNRYADVTCIDQTRVVLRYAQSRSAGDYIHANLVNTLLPYNRFICAQGPLASTVVDWWRMVWQEKARHIVMLCRTEEDGKSKCHKYWPEPDSPLIIGRLTITQGRNETADTGFTTTVLTVTEAGGKEELRVRLHQLLDWPDRGVPDSPLAPLRLLKKVRDDRGATTVVHCSAGIGRTGTVVGMEMCLRQLFDGRPLFVAEVLKLLRVQRVGCVQTEAQYVYIHRALLDYLKIKSIVTRADVHGFFDACDAFLRGRP